MSNVNKTLFCIIINTKLAGFEIEKPKERNSENSDKEDDDEEDPTEWMAKLFPTREKTVRKGCRSIPIPDEIFKLLEYFQKTIREHLKPKPEVESLWISFKTEPFNKDIK
jgi:hypothetical protein